MLKYFKTIGVLAISVLLITSCSGPGEVHEYSVTDLEFSLEGPLFAGPNSGQTEISIDLADALGDAYVEGMKISGGGSIINFSSISYMMGNEGYPAYATAKSAITGLTRSLARELGPHSIRVNAIMPGWVLTKRQMKLWATEEGLSKHLDRQCLKEHLSGSDIVGGTLFLASGTSKMMTSQALVIDGGVVVTG